MLTYKQQIFAKIVFIIFNCSVFCDQYHDPHFIGNRSVIVHLFEWKWNDIGTECERFLGPKGYGGVQISPPTENTIIQNRPWWERYQPISYHLITRSGNENEFRNMIRKCNSANVRIYVDTLLNHMTAPQERGIVGVGGTIANVTAKHFPAVPYTNEDFHVSCPIRDYNNPTEVRNCELQGLLDLDQSKQRVRDRLVAFMNYLIDMGIAGFRIDAAKHMWPHDLGIIYSKLKNLSTSAGFPPKMRPFIYQEVIDLGNEAIKKTEYNSLGVVTEFRYSTEIGRIFRGYNQLKYLKNWGAEWGFLPSKDALVFIDNHDNQRGHGPGGNDILTHKESSSYKLSAIFMLAHPYGLARVMSSYGFTNSDQGPPSDKKGNILSPEINLNGTCGDNGWICEHRWKEIANMVEFRSIVKGTEISNWWDNGNNQIAFCRDSKGCVVINNENHELSVNFHTNLPPGTYCDIISGNKEGHRCTGKSLVVDNDGIVDIKMPKEKSAIVVHVMAKIQ